MKRLLIIVPLLFSSIDAQELKVAENGINRGSQLGRLSNVYYNYAQAVSIAKQSKKKLFILFEKDYCPWCSKLKNSTLQDRKLTNLLNNEFVFVILNKDRDKFPMQYDPSRVPVVYMANYNEKVFVRKLGYISNPNEYIRLSKYVTQ